VNAFIVQSIGNPHSLDMAEIAAFAAARPDWKLERNVGTGTNLGNGDWTASRFDGAFETRVSAFTLRHLHHRTQ
jgi:hypothetical protein